MIAPDLEYIVMSEGGLVTSVTRQQAVTRAKEMSMSYDSRVFVVYQIHEVFRTTAPLVLDPLPPAPRRA
jgi:hypothetical protein